MRSGRFHRMAHRASPRAVGSSDRAFSDPIALVEHSTVRMSTSLSGKGMNCSQAFSHSRMKAG